MPVPMMILEITHWALTMNRVPTPEVKDVALFAFRSVAPLPNLNTS